MVNLEVIASRAAELGDKVNFLFKAIEKESEEMLSFLNNTFEQYGDKLNSLKYDL